MIAPPPVLMPAFRVSMWRVDELVVRVKRSQDVKIEARFVLLANWDLPSRRGWPGLLLRRTVCRLVISDGRDLLSTQESAARLDEGSSGFTRDQLSLRCARRVKSG